MELVSSLFYIQFRYGPIAYHHFSDYFEKRLDTSIPCRNKLFCVSNEEGKVHLSHSIMYFRMLYKTFIALISESMFVMNFIYFSMCFVFRLSQPCTFVNYLVKLNNCFYLVKMNKSVRFFFHNCIFIYIHIGNLEIFCSQ